MSYKNIEKRRETQREYYHSHPKHIENKNLYKKERNKHIKEMVFNKYGNECACCGENRFEFLVIHHTNGGGNKERRKLKMTGGGVPFYYYLYKNGFPKGYRTLCQNCNHSLGIYDYCPHNRNFK